MASGIYQITNQTNGKRYIGSATNLKNRWAVHLCALRKGRHYNEHLQRAFKKYGEDAFVFSVLEQVVVENLIVHEQRFLDGLNPEYNMASTAGSQLGYEHSLEARRQMSEAHKGVKLSQEHRSNMSAASTGERNHNYGKRASAATRAKMSATRKGRHPSLETRRKLSDAQRGERNGFYGNHHTEEARRRIGDAFRGKPLTDKHKRKISIAWTPERREAQSKRMATENRRRAALRREVLRA